MSIKIALLKSGENVISDAKELVSDDKVCGYLFQKPHVVEWNVPTFLAENQGESSGELEVSLSPWILLSAEKEVVVTPDWIVTAVDPIKSVIKMYEEKVNGQSN